MADDTSAAATGGRGGGCDCGGDCAAAAKSRPMNTRIGTWSEDGKVFTTKIDLGNGVKDKDVKNAILGLGEGDHDVLVSRTYKKKLVVKSTTVVR